MPGQSSSALAQPETPVAEAGQLRLGDHRDRERGVPAVAVHAVRPRRQRGVPFQERLQQALVARVVAVQQRLPPIRQEVLVGFLVRPSG
jgi:hypothetical protein